MPDGQRLQPSLPDCPDQHRRQPQERPSAAQTDTSAQHGQRDGQRTESAERAGERRTDGQHSGAAPGERRGQPAAQTVKPCQTASTGDHPEPETGTAAPPHRLPAPSRHGQTHGGRQGEREKGMERERTKNSSKAAQFDHPPDCQPRPRHQSAWTARDYQTAPDGKNRPDGHPARFCFCGVCRTELD